jgi:hypothetical protein
MLVSSKGICSWTAQLTVPYGSFFLQKIISCVCQLELEAALYFRGAALAVRLAPIGKVSKVVPLDAILTALNRLSARFTKNPFRDGRPGLAHASVEVGNDMWI